MFRFHHVSIFLQQLMDVTGLKDYKFSLLLLFLCTLPEVVGLQNPSGTTL